jgi:hypothetical protein
VTQCLWETYQTTCFLLPENTSLQKADLCRNFAIVSARNPEGKEQSLHLNLEAENTLKQWLNRRGYNYNRIYGCSPSLDYVEPSLMVDMPDKTCAIEAAAVFRQNALFWVSDNQLYLVPCSQISNSEVNLGVFSKRLIQANLIRDKTNT